MSGHKRNYDYFKYALPSGEPIAYANNALTILREIKSHFPQFYGSLSAPSEVLTLSGVRAFDTYYDLGENATPTEINALKLLLRKYGVILLEETFRFGNDVFSDNRYSLVSIEGLKDIPSRYKHMPEPGWNEPDFNHLEHDTDFFLWWATWQRNILLVSELDDTCKHWLANTSWMAHDMTFGMLLGYPGEAICSDLYLTEVEVDAGRELHAIIRHSDKFDGAHPVYLYLKDVSSSPNIIQHQELWSSILDGVYTALP